MTRLLIINADDYGLSPGVSAGVLRAAEGLVTSTTVMANLVAPLEVDFLRRIGLSVGAHLTISVGMPVGGAYPAELLGPYGGFDKAQALQAATWKDRARRRAVEEEWRAQLHKLRELGLALDHIDSHHHVHLLEPLFPLALALAQDYGLALRTRAPQRETARAAGVQAPDVLDERFFGIKNVEAGHLLAMLDDVTGDVVEVMCHPGLTDGLLKLRSDYAAEREAELEVLCDTGLKEEIKRRGWTLSGYRW